MNRPVSFFRKKIQGCGLFLLLLFPFLSQAQSLPDSCRLEIGTNLSGICDWCTEMPFVDLMKQSRSWLTSNAGWVGGGENAWDTQLLDSVPRDEQGYPLYSPFEVMEAETLQVVKTIWADCSGWPEGTYTVLYDGVGQLQFQGDATLTHQQPGRYEFQYQHPMDREGQVIMTIQQSDSSNHLRNIRVLMPGTESTYQRQPFYDLWRSRLQPFEALRFMNWGHTNDYGYDDFWQEWDTTEQDWSHWEDRAKMDDYTWSTSKGVPYEMMIRACNELQKDLWICIPHNADSNFIASLARLVRDQLDPELKVYVEYSNEIWNWIFGQTHWLNHFGCERKNISWPEGIVPYIQRALDIWSEVFRDEMHRVERVVGVQTGWLDVSQRICYNLDPGSFDAVGATYYFGLSNRADSILDEMGDQAQASDIARWVRANLPNHLSQIQQIKTTIADSLNKNFLYYEGGQHITPHPFGQPSTYDQALLDIQRDTAMYHLYDEWFRHLRTLVQGDQPHLLMNFSFVNRRSARYGSWGLLESIDQDTSQIPAPKYRATLQQIHPGCDSGTVSADGIPAFPKPHLNIYPNPVQNTLRVQCNQPMESIQIFNANGQQVYFQSKVGRDCRIRLSAFPRGMYFLRAMTTNGPLNYKFVKH